MNIAKFLQTLKFDQATEEGVLVANINPRGHAIA